MLFDLISHLVVVTQALISNYLMKVGDEIVLESLVSRLVTS
jgi:hypothetical protein